MKEIHDHKTNAVNEELTIRVLDEPGAGGAHHQYSIEWARGEVIPLDKTCFIGFQNGPIKENGVNGVTQEALLAIVIDRLRSFQAGPYSCKENSVALTHIETGLLWLQKRTHDRVRRGVEGTHQK